MALLPEIMFSDPKLKTQNVHPAEIPFQKTMPFFLKCHRPASREVGENIKLRRKRIPSDLEVQFR